MRSLMVMIYLLIDYFSFKYKVTHCTKKMKWRAAGLAQRVSKGLTRRCSPILQMDSRRNPFVH